MATYFLDHYTVNGQSVTAQSVNLQVDRDFEVIAVYQEGPPPPPAPNPLSAIVAAGTVIYIALI